MEYNLFFVRQRHRIIVLKIKALLIGLESEQNLQSNICDFDEWIHKQSTSKLKDTPHITDLQQTHTQFHATATNIIELYKQGKKEEAQEQFKNFEKISDTLLYLLQEIEKQIELS